MIRSTRLSMSGTAWRRESRFPLLGQRTPGLPPVAVKLDRTFDSLDDRRALRDCAGRRGGETARLLSGAFRSTRSAATVFPTRPGNRQSGGRGFSTTRMSALTRTLCWSWPATRGASAFTPPTAQLKATATTRTARSEMAVNSRPSADPPRAQTCWLRAPPTAFPAEARPQPRSCRRHAYAQSGSHPPHRGCRSSATP